MLDKKIIIFMPSIEGGGVKKIYLKYVTFFLQNIKSKFDNSFK